MVKKNYIQFFDPCRNIFKLIFYVFTYGIKILKFWILGIMKDTRFELKTKFELKK
jgi:hypothetical protein